MSPRGDTRISPEATGGAWPVPIPGCHPAVPAGNGDRSGAGPVSDRQGKKKKSREKKIPGKNIPGGKKSQGKKISRGKKKSQECRAQGARTPARPLTCATAGATAPAGCPQPQGAGAGMSSSGPAPRPCPLPSPSQRLCPQPCQPRRGTNVTLGPQILCASRPQGHLPAI